MVKEKFIDIRRINFDSARWMFRYPVRWKMVGLGSLCCAMSFIIPGDCGLGIALGLMLQVPLPLKVQIKHKATDIFDFVRRKWFLFR